MKPSNPGCRSLPVMVSRGALVIAFVVAFATSAVVAQDKVEKPGVEAVYDGLEWRFIGPYRGGRAVAVMKPLLQFI